MAKTVLTDELLDAFLEGRTSLEENTKKREALTPVSGVRASLLKKMAASYSPALHCSTIGAGGLNFSVRNGKRWDPAAIAT